MKSRKLAIAMLATLAFVVGSCNSDDDSNGSVILPPSSSVPDYLKEGTDARPYWVAPDDRLFESMMSLQVQLGDTLVNYQSANDLICATIDDEVRAVTGPQTTAGEVYYPLSIYSDGRAVTIALRYYCDRLHRIYTITNWATFDPSCAPLGDDGIYRPKFTLGK